MKFWKAVGLAGLAGVTASGVIIARDRRQRAQVTPDEARARLRERLDEAEGDTTGGSAGREGRLGGT